MKTIIKNNNMKQEEIDIKLTEQEIQVLISIIDIAIRSKGLDIASNAVVLYSKIKNSIREHELKKTESDEESAK